jgi:hypothetical protein
MYSSVDMAFCEMICQRYGDGIWERIKDRSGVDLSLCAVDKSCPDTITCGLVGAAGVVLGLSESDLFEALGEYWALHVNEGNGEVATRAVREALSGDRATAHAQNRDVVSHLGAPQFIDQGSPYCSMHVHYYTHRAGLGSFMKGRLQGVVKRYRPDAVVEWVASTGSGSTHDVFAIHWTAVKQPSTAHCRMA